LATSRFSIRWSKKGGVFLSFLQQHREGFAQQRFGQCHIVGEVGERDLRAIIQNSARWRVVLEFSAREVGPRV
jgi:hypothetical protein